MPNMNDVRPARASGARVEASDGTRYDVYDDGSRRRNPRKLRGKAAVKRAKRQRTR